MPSKRQFTVIQGGASGGSASAPTTISSAAGGSSAPAIATAASANSGLADGIFYDASGNAWHKGATHGGGGGGPPTASGGSGGGGEPMTPFWRTDIVRDVQFAKWGVAGLGAVVAAMLWFLLTQIDNRFDRADTKISDMTEKVGDLRVEIAGQRGDIKAILEKIDDKSLGSAQAKQTGSVREGASPRP